MLNPQLYIYSDSIFNKQDSGVAFNRGNEDYVDFGVGKAWIDANDFEIEIKVSGLVENLSSDLGIAGIIGQGYWGVHDGRWELMSSDSGIEFYITAGNTVVDTDLSMSFISNGTIKVTGNNGSFEMYLNDVLMATHTTTTMTSIDSSLRMSIGAHNDSDGVSIRPDHYINGIVHWAKITSFGVTNTLELNEGSGDTVTWSEGDTGTISTSEPTGINYINDTMWKLKIVEESGLQDVEIFEEDNVILTSSVQNIKDISKIFTDFTKSFTVPASPANNKIFKHWYKAEIEGGFNANLRKTATMELNLQPFKKGKIQLNKVQKKNGVAVNYQLQFFGDVVQLTDAFGEDLLTDLDLSAYGHDFDSDNVLDSSFKVGVSLFSLDVIYPMISFNRVWTMGDGSTTDLRFSTKIADSGIYWDELKPAIRLQRILDAISLKYGLTFSDHFFNTTDFLKLYLLASKDSGLMTPFGEPVLMSYDGTGASAGDDGVQWFTILGTWTHGQVIAAFVPDAGYEEVEYSITKVVNGVEYPPESHVGNSSAAVFQQGGSGADDLQVGFYISGSQSFHFTSTVNLLDVPTTHYEGAATTQSLTGYVYFTDEEVNGITQLGELPEMKVVDFFRGLTQMFNLVVVPDGERFIVQTLDSWYEAGTTKDFSKYIDLSGESVNRTDIHKIINFNYEEPETLIQVEFEDTNDRYYGDLEYETDVDGDVFEIKLPFENLVGGLMSDDTDGLTNVRVSYVLDKDSEAIKTKPMIFYNAGQETSTEPLCFEEDDGTQLEIFKYRNLGQENDLTSTLITHSLNWGSEVSTNTLGITENSLFADYWSTYITDIFDENRRMFKFSGIIPSGVLSNLKLNDKLIINGRRYIINQYTANLKTGRVNFELLNDVLELESLEVNTDGLQYDLQTGITG